MKKTIRVIAVIAIMFFAAGQSANAQGLLGKLANAAQSAAKGNSTLSNVVNVISSKLVPSEDQVIGTWVYQGPAVVFETESALTNIGGTAASAKIEEKLQQHLSKVGVVAGKMSLTFKEDKTFTVTYGKRSVSGTYTIADNKVSMTFKGRNTPCKVTPQLNNGSLVITADATKIKDFVTGLTGTSTNTSLATISSLLKQVKGMQLGVRLKK